MKELIKIFKALSDPNRLRILKMLEVQPLCVCEITEILQLATSTVSKHLSILRDAELISDTKDGKWVNYRLNENTTLPYSAEMLVMLKQWLNEELVIQRDGQQAAVVDRDSICGLKRELSR